MIRHDITETNHAVRQLIERTENPRHRFLLMVHDRHRNLEMAGRYEEIFAPDMTVEKPVYHLRVNDMGVRLEGAEAVKSLYRMWAATNQSVFYTVTEQLAVADNFVTSTAVACQQVSGRTLAPLIKPLPSFEESWCSPRLKCRRRKRGRLRRQQRRHVLAQPNVK